MDSQRRSSVVDDGADDASPSGQTHTTHPPGGDPGKERRLFIHCSPDASPLLLYHMCSSHGRVEHLKPLTDRETGLFAGKVFVKFCESSSAEAAKTALHGSVHNNEPMYVQFAQPLSKLRSGEQSFADLDWPPHSRVFVACAKDLTLLELHNLCKTFGDVQHAVIMTDKNTGESRGVGYVKFDTADAALRAVTTLNSQPGRRVLCRIAQPHWVHAAKSTDPGNYEDGPFTAAEASAERGPEDFGRFLTSILPGGIGGDRGDRGGNLGVPDLRTLFAAVAGSKDAPPGGTPSEEGVPIDLHLHMAEVALKYILGYAHADIAKLKLAELNKLVALINAAASSPPPPPTPSNPGSSELFAECFAELFADPPTGSAEHVAAADPRVQRALQALLQTMQNADKSSEAEDFSAIRGGQGSSASSSAPMPQRDDSPNFPPSSLLSMLRRNDIRDAASSSPLNTDHTYTSHPMPPGGLGLPDGPPARATASALSGARPDFFPPASALFDKQHNAGRRMPNEAAIQGLLQAAKMAAKGFRGGPAGSSASSSAPMMPRRNDSPSLPPAAAASSSLASPFVLPGGVGQPDHPQTQASFSGEGSSGGLTSDQLKRLHDFVSFIAS